MSTKNLEKRFISKENRFSINKKELSELRQNFSKSVILLTGATGSIGVEFVKNLKNFDFKKLYLIDKDENSLTELNRELILIFKKKKIINTNYICADINQIDINLFIKEKKISHYLNFAAIKHVRSEDEILSAKYLFNTNSKNFLKIKKFNKSNLKLVFSISSDKAVEPSSFLGASKKLMEDRLFKFKRLNKKIFVSTTRFANVSFSNGSILKYLYERILNKKILGVPKNVERYFITHEEAISLCFRALLKNANNKIVVPKLELVKPSIKIEILTLKILKYLGFKNTNNKKKHLNKKNFYINFSKNNFSGQKNYEKFYEEQETSKLIYNKNTVHIIPSLFKFDNEALLNKIDKLNSLQKIKNLLSLKIKTYKQIKDSIKIKNIL